MVKFKNIYNFLPIEFKNIQASINDQWDYVIVLSGIQKSLRWKDINYDIELESKYLFATHVFSRLVFRLKKQDNLPGYELNGTLIEILPARIELLSLPNMLQDLGYYLDAIKSSYNWQNSIVIDLAGKQILLDNVSVIPKLPGSE